MFAGQIVLTRGTALVLVHPDPELRSMVARGIAKAYGSFAETSAEALLSSGTPHFLAWLRKQLHTLVLDGEPTTPPAFNRLQAMLINDRMVVADGGRQIEVTPPNLIFCTGDANWIREQQHQRRFRVLQVDALSVHAR